MLTDPSQLLILLLVVAFASYVQTVAGFGYGLILMGVIGWLQLIPLPIAAILVSLTSLVNVMVALKGGATAIRWKLFASITAGLLPGMLAGVWLLEYLSSETEQVLQILLGGTLLGGGFLLMLKPTPYLHCSHPASLAAFGLLGGVSGGLFSVAGPPIVFQLYRQPLPLSTLKATLLAVFGFSTLGRIAAVSVQGSMTLDILWTGLLATPVVSLATLAGRRFPPALSDTNVKRGAFLMVAVMGIALLL